MPAQQGTGKGRILLIEDDRASRSALTALLRLCGFEPLPATTIAEGLQMLAWNPSCLILDLMLPDGNGEELLAHIRRNKLPIRVVVTTGAVDWQHRLALSPTPPDAVFQKPVDFTNLVGWLNQHCGAPPTTP
jgi:DNA-binding response OmpR family regulator